ncbi:MAG TPA: glycoside hydrolase family 15 protein, partial [Armatimonadota bacterium]|nr:glycoside hydrolase family 15 protein [Armatimonadota bacterium]
RTSAAVLRAHTAKVFLGGEIASLSIPWGNAKGDHDLGGYHLVWTRDLVESISGLMATGAGADAVEALNFLHVTQEVDGHWTQNMWLDGTPYWTGVQMDEVGFPILLIGIALREGYLSEQEALKYRGMIRRAVSYLVQNGPVTQQDRWEEDAGYSPFTLAVEIAALLVAADLVEAMGDNDEATYLREVADIWNASIERWTYVTGTHMAQQAGADGYYVRIAPPAAGSSEPLAADKLVLKNRPAGVAEVIASDVVSCDALALVRFGLRAPDDPHIVNTVKVIDRYLKVETPYGPTWHRYNGDGYGEHADGAPFDGTGIGRTWPLLVGERAHYELAADHPEEAERLRHAMEAFANEGGMIPEQTWDAHDIPSHELFFGRPSGSAMPLVWAHAEYVKLCRSLRQGQIFDMLPQPSQRYLIEKHGSNISSWRFNNKSHNMPVGNILRIEVLAPATIHWSTDEWKTVHDTATTATNLGVHYADIPTRDITEGHRVLFTFYWSQADRWEGKDFWVCIIAAADYW